MTSAFARAPSGGVRVQAQPYALAERVTSGQVLMRIDAKDLDLALTSRENAIAAAQAQLQSIGRAASDELQAQGVPLEGEAGMGYRLGAGYDLPPMMFMAGKLENRGKA